MCVLEPGPRPPGGNGESQLPWGEGEVLGEMAGPHLCHRDDLGCGSEVGWGELLQLV